jgi:hypothetical protein
MLAAGSPASIEVHLSLSLKQQSIVCFDRLHVSGPPRFSPWVSAHVALFTRSALAEA